MKIHIPVKKLRPDTELPKYATDGSSGFDLQAAEEVAINPFRTELIPTGIAVAVPAGFELQISPRSGLSSKTKLRIPNSPGTVDSKK